MPEKRLSGSKNYLYLGELGTEVVGNGATPLSGEKFFKITAKGGASTFPATSVVGDVVYNKPAITPATGDKAKPVTLTKLGFVTNVPQGASKEKFEDTVQSDDVKSFSESDKSEITGNVDGYFVAEAAKLADILNRFFRVVSDNGAGAVTYAPTTVGTFHFFLGRNETVVVGEIEIMEYMPSIVDSLTVDKPMDGKQTFGFGYTVVGAERPSIYNRTITA
jgi:hypothetical protein